MRSTNVTPITDSFEEERREVLESVFEALCGRKLDQDEMAACKYLVRHLAPIPL
jgi:hypothetical protein